MDYTTWGAEYLTEANRIKAHIQTIKSSESGSEDQQFFNQRRVNILYNMYLECRATGRLLQNRGRWQALADKHSES